MTHQPIWISGATRTGKTTHLVNQFCDWVQQNRYLTRSQPLAELPGVLLLAAIGDNRLELVDRLTAATQGKYPFRSTTPLGFFQDEVMLFYPLLVEALDLRAQFPLRLAPENEQELASQLWQPVLDRVIAQRSPLTEARLVRRLLDLRQLAALAGMAIGDIPTILEQGLAEPGEELPLPYDTIGELLELWQTWCLERGFLTYSIIAGLYWKYLLPHPTYQQHLSQRYQVLLADDVDEYPAIARALFEVMLDRGVTAVFTCNPDGAVRQGLGADPVYLMGLADRCQVKELTERPVVCLGNDLGEATVELAINPGFFAGLPAAFQVVQTTARAQLLQRTGEIILEAVQSGQIQPQEIAVIAPGFDPIARYSLGELLTSHQIPVESLNDQRPLTSAPIVRALLTLLALVYPNLGRLVEREGVAEMLVVLAGRQPQAIDPVRAGLLADSCFLPHPDLPQLLPVSTFPRWDRLGYQASNAYQAIVDWIATQQEQLEQRLIPNPVALLDRGIQHFLVGGNTLPFEQLSALRQLLETAQHYWEVDGRLRRSERHEAPAYMTVSRFIQLLRSGTVTANPYPVRPIGPASKAVTLANVFQYRSSRRAHRWQFWLDAGSPRWLSGVDALFAAPLFLQEWSGRPWTAADTLQVNERRLRRILLDLLGRTGERVYLCHSELATSGQEQNGVLLSLVNAAIPLEL